MLVGGATLEPKWPMQKTGKKKHVFRRSMAVSERERPDTRVSVKVGGYAWATRGLRAATQCRGARTAFKRVKTNPTFPFLLAALIVRSSQRCASAQPRPQTVGEFLKLCIRKAPTPATVESSFYPPLHDGYAGIRALHTRLRGLVLVPFLYLAVKRQTKSWLNYLN